MRQRRKSSRVLVAVRRSLICWVVTAPLVACSNLLGSMAADTLSATILNQDDPELLRTGVPAYLLLVDGFISENPDNADLLAAGAQLFALVRLSVRRKRRASGDADREGAPLRRARDLPRACPGVRLGGLGLRFVRRCSQRG